MKRRSERSQGERKGDTQKLTQTTAKKKEGSKAKCPKTHVQGCVAPNPKKNAHKSEKHQTKRGGCEEDHLKFAKRARKKKTRKDAKTLRTAAARPT